MTQANTEGGREREREREREEKGQRETEREKHTHTHTHRRIRKRERTERGRAQRRQTEWRETVRDRPQTEDNGALRQQLDPFVSFDELPGLGRAESVHMTDENVNKHTHTHTHTHTLAHSATQPFTPTPHPHPPSRACGQVRLNRVLDDLEQRVGPVDCSDFELVQKLHLCTHPFAYASRRGACTRTHAHASAAHTSHGRTRA